MTTNGTTVDDFDDDIDDDDEAGTVDNKRKNGKDDDSGTKPNEADDDRKVANARRDRQRLRRQLDDTKAELNKLKTKDLPEAEKLRTERDELAAKVAAGDAKLRKLTLRTSALEVATHLGFRNPQLAARLLDSDEVDWDDDGEPTNVTELLKAVLKQEPSLKRGRRNSDDGDDDAGDEDTDVDAGRGRKRKGGAADDMNDRIRMGFGR